MNVSKELDYLDQLEQEISSLALSQSKEYPVSLLSKKVGKSTSLIYKYSSPTEDSYFPLEWLPLFMNIKNNYDILDLICRLTGHLPPVRCPVFKMMKGDEMKIGADFNKTISELGPAFLELLHEPTKDKQKEFKKLAVKSIKGILSALNYAEKAIKAQGELEL